MAGLRAPRAGSARENQIKVENSFDSEEALKCLAWIREITGEPINLESVLDNKHKVSEFFYRTLKDGILLCKLVNAIVPDDIQINMKSQTFKKSNNDAFESAKERARIELFCQKIQEFGVPENMSFQTDSLYEKTNLPQVCAAIRNFGIEAESRPSFSGSRTWPKRAEQNRRNFSEEQLRASEGVINLQMGSNKGATQSGMTFGKKRMITKD
ncbi:myophilin-like isoform X1 [Biomphalaria glabrata]|uniref:Transgelin n=1 Tax=Biomphalaria glabrata TaxID=6526 RepID=A0A9W3AN09_BIOGL|nr:myophilin-like isoform X1 [Biomphalaria glabrata]XP_055888621.1 myophilin-like isoform X1 [Biomphalaria glabrata]